MDDAKTLFEHIRNRLPTGYGLGDDGTEYIDNVPNHKVFNQAIREDKEGDVGIFEVYRTEQPNYKNYSCYIAEVQIAVVTKEGDINSAMNYLKDALENIRTNEMSEHIWIKNCSLVNMKPLGKNGNGLQMCVLNIKIKFLEN